MSGIGIGIGIGIGTGTGTVRRDYRVVDHLAWQRARVCELCLCLAVVEQPPCAQLAATRPDRDERSAGQNLRVTLSHLLDVLDPDRERAQRSHLLRETSAAICLDSSSGLRVDVWEVRRHAELVLTTRDDQRGSVLARPRRLPAFPTGPLLDATPIGEWCSPYRRRLDDLVRGASCRAGDLALHSNDLRLGVDPGRLTLAVDPWSEDGHRLVIESQLAQCDLDGARWAQLQAVSLLDDLGVPPGRAIVLLGYRLGLTGERRMNASR